MKRKLNSQKIAPYVFVLPFVILFGMFFVYAIGNMIVMSFQSVNIGDIHFIKFENYRMLFSNSSFPIAIRNSITYTILTLIVLIPFPMLFAVMLNSKSMRGSDFFRGILFLPLLCSIVVAGFTFRFLFNETNASLVNAFIVNVLGGDIIPWTRLRWPAMSLLVILATWRWTGINIVYFLSGLNSIPVELYEACDMDGANAWQRLRCLTIPLLKPTLIYVLTISIYGGLAMFVESQMIWAGKSSPNNIGLTIVGFIYQNGISQGNLGLASATGFLLLIVVLAINLAQLKLSGALDRENN